MKNIEIVRASPQEVASILKLITKVHESHFSEYPMIIERFTLPWVTQVVCYGLVVSAKQNGRLVGTLGISRVEYPWNHYVARYVTEWLHVLDLFIDDGVRNMMIDFAHNDLKERDQESRLIVKIPHYLREDDDAKRTPSATEFEFDA